jgi:hypothetical protein
MLDAAAFAIWQTTAFLYALFGAVAVKLLVGEINVAHLLEDKLPAVAMQARANAGRHRQQRGRLSFERVQLLVFTIGVAIAYISEAYANRSSGVLPDVPESMLVVLTGSNGVYLAGKAWTFLSRLGLLRQ